MKADTFAKLLALETLVDAEIGQFLETHAPSPDGLREGLVARVSDLLDEIDALDSVAAARVYDAIVDFLAELPADDEGMIAATLRFKRAVDRVIDRGLDERDFKQAATWAILLDELLAELSREYHAAVARDRSVASREYLRAQVLLARAREAAERMLWSAGPELRGEVRNAMDRLTYAVRHQRLEPAAVDLLLRAPQKHARRHRASTFTRIGSFILGQLLRRTGSAKQARTA